MEARARESSKASSPVSHMAGWTRQGVESFVAAQKVLLDLIAEQNALVLGMVRKRLREPNLGPINTIAKIADKGVENLAAAGKILLDLAARETALVVDGVKEGLRLPAAAGAVANVVRYRVDALMDMQKRLLDVTAEQTHEFAKSYEEGKNLLVGVSASLAELVRLGIEGFVETEKKFLDLTVHEATTAKAGKEGRKSTGERSEAVTHLAQQGVEKYIDAQKKILHLAIEQIEFAGKATGESLEAAGKEARTSLGELTEKSVQNFARAQKSLMHLATKPTKASPTEETPKASRARARGKKHPVEVHEAA